MNLFHWNILSIKEDLLNNFAHQINEFILSCN